MEDPMLADRQLLCVALFAASAATVALEAQIAEPDPSQPAAVVVSIVEATSASNIWISGGAPSEIWRWNGTALRHLPIPEALVGENSIEGIRSISVVSPTLAFVAGDQGSLWRYSGTRYERMNILPPQVRAKLLVFARSASALWVVSDTAGGTAGYLWVPDSANPGHLIPKLLPFRFTPRHIAAYGSGVIISGYVQASASSSANGVLISYEDGRFTSHGWSPERTNAEFFTGRSMGLIETNGSRILVHFFDGASGDRGSTALVRTETGWRPISTVGGVLQFKYTVKRDGKILVMSHRGLQQMDSVLYPDDGMLSPAPRFRTHRLFSFSADTTLAVEGEMLVRYTRSARTALARVRLP